ncbi:hypothetical protein K461DRAFT_324831 [Myriangium duriaei CBS 260.36]|uniref:2EXR domain-containing protein n=1 Tax=Myriangium duriaei CBS 260.36 TaxID=1168546 RepID=A0A9P4IXE2_9PEZI|nr:hypothetical protein K461DRAFT_324831 [Myriangium duriaei CBS 260.36]
MTTAATFPQFSRLPPEIRLAIWQLSIPSEPGLYWCESTIAADCYPLSIQIYRRTSCKTSLDLNLDIVYPLPFIASVTGEARKVALDHAKKEAQKLHQMPVNGEKSANNPIRAIRTESEVLFFRSDRQLTASLWYSSSFSKGGPADDVAAGDFARWFAEGDIVIHQEALIDSPLLRWLIRRTRTLYVVFGHPSIFPYKLGVIHGVKWRWDDEKDEWYRHESLDSTADMPAALSAEIKAGMQHFTNNVLAHYKSKVIEIYPLMFLPVCHDGSKRV